MAAKPAEAGSENATHLRDPFWTGNLPHGLPPPLPGSGIGMPRPPGPIEMGNRKQYTIVWQ